MQITIDIRRVSGRELDPAALGGFRPEEQLPNGEILDEWDQVENRILQSIAAWIAVGQVEGRLTEKTGEYFWKRTASA